MLSQVNERLVYQYDAEKLWVEAWGPNAVRIRCTMNAVMPTNDWALAQRPPSRCEVTISPDSGILTNGNIIVTISRHGKLTMRNSDGKVLLEEFVRTRRDILDPKCSALEVEARQFKAVVGGADFFHLTARFEALNPNEKIFGMGQYQQPCLDLKGHDIELAHRNSQASVPFAVSSEGYGFLWNNPAIGRAVFGKNLTTFEAYSTQSLDYWVVAGSTPAELVESYAGVTGKVPMMPEYGLGFWQCKLRYQTQSELLEIARAYKSRNLPINVIVVDFFHWPLQGDWKFDSTYWPDPDGMVAELKDMGIELMVSIWPTVDKRCSNYYEMLERGYLIRVERGVRTSFDFEGETIHLDVTRPGAREYIWSKVKANYYSKGIKLFWLDEAEPEYTVYDFDNYRYHLGSNVSVGNVYPLDYARAFYEGQRAEGQTEIVNLVRCSWAGSQKYGALVWSGDIASSWESMRDQLAAGLSMGLSGIPWWTTDIGGFHGGDPNDDSFRELFVRWFQWGTFCPVMRLHGDREPRQPQQGTTGGATCCSGAANEVWSYGDDVFEICKKYMLLREELREYTRGLMREAHLKGTPVMRTMFYEFPQDAKCWDLGEQYMYGNKYLCCPVLKPGMSKLTVYLPKLPGSTKWNMLHSAISYDGDQTIQVDCPMEVMPVFARE